MSLRSKVNLNTATNWRSKATLSKKVRQRSVANLKPRLISAPHMITPDM